MTVGVLFVERLAPDIEGNKRRQDGHEITATFHPVGKDRFGVTEIPRHELHDHQKGVEPKPDLDNLIRPLKTLIPLHLSSQGAPEANQAGTR